MKKEKETEYFLRSLGHHTNQIVSGDRRRNTDGTDGEGEAVCRSRDFSKHLGHVPSGIRVKLHSKVMCLCLRLEESSRKLQKCLDIKRQP
jgi:hypothetical protein